MALGVSSCIAILRCCLLETECHPSAVSDVVTLGLPCVIICGRGDGTATKYRLILHEILPSTGEDCTVRDQ